MIPIELLQDYVKEGFDFISLIMLNYPLVNNGLDSKPKNNI